jgi:rhamnosyltransferase
MHVNPIRRSDICALVITHQPDDEITRYLAAIRPQVGALVVVDNNSNPDILGILNRSAEQFEFELIINKENVGVATALNQGVDWAKSKGYRWLLTLDDDTEALPFMVDTLIAVHDSLENKEKVALIGSSYWGREQHIRSPDTGLDLFSIVKAVITSGTLASLSAVDRIGPFRDSFFIDHVDTEYSLRARSRGYIVVKALKPAMLHSIGTASTHAIGWMKTQTTNHSALRRYYSTRNLIFVSRLFYKAEFLWVVSTIYSWMKSVVLISLFENDRPAKLRSILAGILDGFRIPLTP